MLKNIEFLKELGLSEWNMDVNGPILSPNMHCTHIPFENNKHIYYPYSDGVTVLREDKKDKSTLYFKMLEE